MSLILAIQLLNESSVADCHLISLSIPICFLGDMRGPGGEAYCQCGATQQGLSQQDTAREVVMKRDAQKHAELALPKGNLSTNNS